MGAWRYSDLSRYYTYAHLCYFVTCFIARALLLATRVCLQLTKAHSGRLRITKGQLTCIFVFRKGEIQFFFKTRYITSYNCTLKMNAFEMHLKCPFQTFASSTSYKSKNFISVQMELLFGVKYKETVYHENKSV